MERFAATATFSVRVLYFSRTVCLLVILGLLSSFCLDNTYKEQDVLVFCRLCLLISSTPFVNERLSKKA